MKISRLHTLRLRTLAAAALVAACGAAYPPAVRPNTAVAPAALTPAQAQAHGAPGWAWLPRPQAARADRRGSWMRPEAKSMKLLYVSDSTTNDVYVFSYPQGVLEGTLTGFSGPSGLCSNHAGDVFILNGNGSSVDVFAHGGTTPLRTLDLPGYPQLNCSVNPHNGDLALGTFDGNCGECAGFIAIFRKGQGTAVTYQPSGQIGIPGCGYDDSGNLFCTGYGNRTVKFQLYELPKGTTTVNTIAVNDSTLRGGSIQWDGTNLAVDSGSLNTLYQIAVSGSTGTVVGSTQLTQSGGGFYYQFWLARDDTRVIAPVTYVEDVDYWNYPAGGNPTKSITGFTMPDGVTISM